MSKPAILKTLHYADLFDYPLRFEEIEKYSVERLDVGEFEEALTQMTADPPSLKLRGASSKLIYADNYYCLPGREEIIGLRKRREEWSRPKLEKAKQVAGFLKFIPWVKLVGVTGALAVENSDEGDDIDLMVITTLKRLWLTRGLVVAFLLLTGQYRRPGKIKDMICPNLMISEDALEFPDRDLFTAHEIVQMEPIYDREDIYQKFLQANGWVVNFLPNAKRRQKSEGGGQIQKTEIGNRKSVFSHLSSRSVFRFQSSVFLLLENLAYKLQLEFMESKRTTEVTTPSVIRFHPQDTRQWVLDEYRRRVYTLPK